LDDSLKEISSEYDLVRKKSLLEFDKIPRNALESIWHKLGRVKEKDGSENRFSKYYVMATTKQLMFLWGQTLAFDTLIRKMMPSSKYAYIRAQGKENRWAFSMWYNVMSEFQERVLEMPDFIELGYKISSDEFGSDKIVPFGQFVDLYYWIGAKKRKRKTV
jgi:hypothetical protein